MTLNYQTQKKILEPVLKSATNHYCADCNAASPTWASLDFGVFLCSNCSGAHRALGPTITRVKSATLDLWPQQWVDNMLIGNQQLNAYWESDPKCYERKPKWGATNQQVARYVYQKYVKRKFVKDPSVPDPLTLYKANKNQPQLFKRDEPPPVIVSTPIQIFQQPPEDPIKESIDHPDLINFHFDSSHPQIQTHEPHSSGLPQTHLNHHLGVPQQEHEIELSDIPEHGTSFTSQTSENLMSFDQMISNQKNPSPLMHSLSTQHVPRPTFTVPHIQTNQLHLHPPNSNHNIGFTYNQQYQHPQYPHSPQPIIHYPPPQQIYSGHANGQNQNYGQLGQQPQYQQHQHQQQGQYYGQYWQ